MPIRYQKIIRRQDLRDNPRDWYVFGDNVLETGLAGQAKEMRGEPNAIGVATKWFPGRRPRDYFADDQASRSAVEEDLERVEAYLRRGDTVVVPADGIGTGLAELPKRAPKLHAFIQDWFKKRSRF